MKPPPFDYVLAEPVEDALGVVVRRGPLSPDRIRELIRQNETEAIS